MISSGLFQGFLLGAGLIIAIGAQNVFVLRQGLSGRYVFAVALTCSLVDTALIAAGVGGVGTIIAGSTAMTRIAAWGGALFLLGYAVLAVRKALSYRVADSIEPDDPRDIGRNLRKTLAMAAGVSLLNPHVYLDTVVLLGGLSAQHIGSGRLAFAIGASAASFCWFFALAYGARAAASFFARSAAQRGLDLVAATVMTLIAVGLIADQLSEWW